MSPSGPDDGTLSAAERHGIVDQQEAALEAMAPTASRRPTAEGSVTVSRLLAGQGLARVAAGVALAAAPTLAARPWLGPPAGDPAVRLTVRLLGVRDLLLGAATVTAVYQQRSPIGWALAGAAADFVATAANRARLPRSALAIAAIAGTNTGAALALAVGAKRSPSAHNG